MIYDLRRMIYLRCKYDIISVPSYAKHISSTAGGYHTEGISPVPIGTDIIKKPLYFRKEVFLGPTLKMEPVLKPDFLCYNAISHINVYDLQLYNHHTYHMLIHLAFFHIQRHYFRNNLKHLSPVLM